jgi:basic membrane protein A
MKRAERKLGVSVHVRTPTPREGTAASLRAFAAQHYDLVISDVLDSSALQRVARQFPRVRFAILDLSRNFFHNPTPNLIGIVFRRQEAGYLAGYLAGLVERQRPGRHIISAVGGKSVSGVDQYIAGYRAGAKRADPKIAVLYGYSHSWTAPDACAAVASRQIAKGSRVVFDVAGACGPGTLRTAQAHHLWGVGVDFDQLSRWPHILTSAVLRFDDGLFAAIRAVKQGRYKRGTDIVLGLRERAVGIGRINPKVPRSLRARVQQVRLQIAAGKISVPATLGG